MADKVKHVVVDSAGFIRNAPLKDLAENIYSIGEVVNEIRDKATRQRLQVLPYEISFREPSTEAIRTVTEFAKKTGDYRSLSAVDIKLLALTYQLEKEKVGTEHIKTQPSTNNATWTSTTKHLEKPTDIAGFYIGKKTEGQSQSSSESNSSTINTEELQERLENTNISENKSNQINELQENEIDQRSDRNDPEEKNQNVEITVVDRTELVENEKEDNKQKENSVDQPSEMPVSSGEVVNVKGHVRDGDTLPTDCVTEGNDDDDDEGESEEEEAPEEDGWITPRNIKEVKKSMGHVDSEKATVTVGCLTTDFAMQNVLIQMGLNVISVDGMLIKRAKSYVLRCYACMKVTTKMTKEFCPHCGNKTLQKLSMIIKEDGSISYLLSRRRPVSTRGLKYSLPMPKGGKHSSNPILVEDQREAQQRGSKASKIKYDVFDPDYEAHNSPFAPTDVYSRAAYLGIGNQRSGGFNKKRRNPNENKKVYGRRK